MLTPRVTEIVPSWREPHTSSQRARVLASLGVTGQASTRGSRELVEASLLRATRRRVDVPR